MKTPTRTEYATGREEHHYAMIRLSERNLAEVEMRRRARQRVAFDIEACEALPGHQWAPEPAISEMAERLRFRYMIPPFVNHQSFVSKEMAPVLTDEDWNVATVASYEEAARLYNNRRNIARVLADIKALNPDHHDVISIRHLLVMWRDLLDPEPKSKATT